MTTRFFEEASDRCTNYLELGLHYRRLGEYESSLEVLEAGIAEFPENETLRMIRALTLFDLERA